MLTEPEYPEVRGIEMVLAPFLQAWLDLQLLKRQRQLSNFTFSYLGLDIKKPRKSMEPSFTFLDSHKMY